MNVIPDFKASTIIPIHTRNVAPGATIYTDGLKSFAKAISISSKDVLGDEDNRRGRRGLFGFLFSAADTVVSDFGSVQCSGVICFSSNRTGCYPAGVQSGRRGSTSGASQRGSGANQIRNSHRFLPADTSTSMRWRCGKICASRGSASLGAQRKSLNERLERRHYAQPRRIASRTTEAIS
jgi:hypothetical protein